MNTNKMSIGIELGSTRIKAVLIDENYSIVAAGSSSWENTLLDGIWTYSMEEVREGLRACYKDLKNDYFNKTGEVLKRTGAIGISAMMHGYIALDKDDNLLVPFRTWRNTITEKAADILSSTFGFNIPQRWSVAHLYQAMLNNEEHLGSLDKVYTLSSYVHYLLTGEKVIGIGDASGMFPIDSETKDWNKEYVDAFSLKAKELGFTFSIPSLFPRVLSAGENAGYLTKEGALLLDEDGDLEAGIPLSPPEGDAGTGMVATNAVRVGSGNTSAGTSDFAMVVMDHIPPRHRELDMVTTPSGLPVAMVHCNNCTSDINYWAMLFKEFALKLGVDISDNDLFTLLYNEALNATSLPFLDVSCNYYSGEGVTDFNSGIPIFLHNPASPPSLSSFMRCHLYSALATLKIGLDVLKKENIKIERMLGHGGFFKSKAGVRTLSASIASPVTVMETAGEGGAYGMALLSSFLINGKGRSLEDFLDKEVYRDAKVTTVMATEKEIKDYNDFISSYKKILEVERKALEVF